MKRELILATFLSLTFSCGGGGPAQKNVGISSVSKSYIQQDVICCKNYDLQNDICTSYGIPQPINFKVTISNEKFTEQAEPVQVRGCNVYFHPKVGAPEIPEGYQYVTCTPVTIKPGESKTITITLQSPLIEIMHDYYLDIGKTLSYRVEITFDITGYYTGEDYNLTDYVDIDFSNFITSDNDMCRGG